MAQQLITPQHNSKYKTFEDICPTWARILSKGLDTGNIGLSDKCIVGEAWGWSNRYYIGQSNECKTCIHFSDLFPLILFTKNIKISLQAINKFTEHYNNAHILT